MKPNNDKKERIRKRYAVFTKFPRPVGYRKHARRYIRTHCPVAELSERVGTPDPADDCPTGTDDGGGILSGATGPGDGQSGGGTERPSGHPTVLTREKLNHCFRYSKAQYQPEDAVYVIRWGYGVVKGIVKGRIQVFAPQFGATGATIYVGCDRLQRVG